MNESTLGQMYSTPSDKARRERNMARAQEQIERAQRNSELENRLRDMSYVQGWAEIFKVGVGNIVNSVESWFGIRDRGANRIIKTLNTPTQMLA